jgi:hypothetical protein
MVEVIEGIVVHDGVSFVVSEVITELSEADEKRLIDLKVCREIVTDDCDLKIPVQKETQSKTPAAKKPAPAKSSAKKKAAATKATAAKKAATAKSALEEKTEEKSEAEATEENNAEIEPINLVLNLDDVIKAPSKGS